MKTILCIAGSDSLSGGGLQADIRTYESYEIKSLNVVTCIVTIDPMTEDVHVFEIPDKMLKTQLDSCFDERIEISAIKVGMLSDLRTAKLVAEYLRNQSNIPIVLDPVLALKENKKETKEEIITFFKDRLLPLATIVTPNLREAELLTGIQSIESISQMELAAKKLAETGVKNVVVKGGQRFKGKFAVDLFFDGQTFVLLEEKKIRNQYNNGAGCTFASAIAANISDGVSIKQSVFEAKKFVYEAILNGIPLLEQLGNVYQKKRENV